MTRFRKWVLTVGITLALFLLPLASVASADPGDGGGLPPTFSGTSTSTGGNGRPTLPSPTTLDPGDGGGL